MKGFFPLFFAFFILLMSIPAAAQETRGLLDQVQKEFQRHNYKGVIELYDDFIQRHPEKFVPVVVKVLYSQSLADTGEIEDATEVLKGVLSELPREVNPLKLQYDLANLLFMQKRYDEAKAIFQKMLVQSNQDDEIVSRARGRLATLKEREGKKKDVATLQLLDIESSLEASEVPEGAEQFLEGLLKQRPEGDPQTEHVKKLLARINEIRAERATALLEEARRLFDKERKFVEVRQLLEQITDHYSDVADMQSAQLLLNEVNRKLGMASP